MECLLWAELEVGVPLSRVGEETEQQSEGERSQCGYVQARSPARPADVFWLGKGMIRVYVPVTTAAKWLTDELLWNVTPSGEPWPKWFPSPSPALTPVWRLGIKPFPHPPLNNSDETWPGE